MKITIEQINKVLSEIGNEYSETANVIRELARTELARRTNAGRKASCSLSRKEQNRIAQAKYREKNKLE
jgi:hypothetical protein